MSKLGLHIQIVGEAGWTRDFRGPLKIMDPPEHGDWPNATFIVGRTYMPDQESNDLIYHGAAGAEVWYQKWKHIYDTRRYVSAWEGPNEPGHPWNHTFRQVLDEFTVRFAHIMHQEGHKIVGHNWSVGWPDKGHIVQFADSMAVMDFWGLHEYCAPHMNYGEMGTSGCYYWWTLRYRRTVKEARNASIRIPPIIIGECGIDGGVRNDANTPIRPEIGWKGYVPQGVPEAEDWYMNDNLAWYDSEICKDAYVHSAYIFTSAPNNQWRTFEVGQSLAEKIQRHRDTHPTALGGVHDVLPVLPNRPPPIVNLIDQIETNPDVKYPKRWIKYIDTTVVHHSATRAHVIDPVKHIKAFARYHVRKYDWPGIAYHYVVDEEGIIYKTARHANKCYHAGSDSINTKSMGVCLIGNFTKTDPTPEQLKSARWLVKDHLGYKVIPHSDVVPTACPVWRKLKGTLG